MYQAQMLEIWMRHHLKWYHSKDSYHKENELFHEVNEIKLISAEITCIFPNLTKSHIWWFFQPDKCIGFHYEQLWITVDYYVSSCFPYTLHLLFGNLWTDSKKSFKFWLQKFWISSGTSALSLNERRYFHFSQRWVLSHF